MDSNVAKQYNAQRLSTLHPVLASRGHDFLEVLEAGGIEALITQGSRSWEDQARLYSQGRSIPGPIITNAKPGWSWHQFGLAFDVVPLSVLQGEDLTHLAADWNVQHPAWQRMLIVGAGFHLSEGATWRTLKDYPHFYPEGLPDTPPDEIRQVFKTNGLPAVWSWAEARFTT